MADVEIRNVYLGVTGGHIRGFNNRGVHPVVSADREISEDDVQDVIKNAKAINLPTENNVVHAIRQHFFVDGQDGVTNPVGMLGSRLEVDVHVVHGNTNRLQNAIRLVKGLQLEVDEIVFNGLASSLALLTNEQKELGALVIDIGGGTTDYVVYADGVIKHTGVLAVGGDHVSNDLAYGLKVPLSRAEKLKLEHGSALLDEKIKGQTVTITNELGLPLKTVNVEHLQRIMSLRLEEIFQLVAQDLEQAGLYRLFARGRFSLRRRRARSRTLPSSPSTSCKCPFPSARPIPSAASNPRSTSRNSSPPSAWSNLARSRPANAKANRRWRQGIKGTLRRFHATALNSTCHENQNSNSRGHARTHRNAPPLENHSASAAPASACSR